jgi:hypothetical protein
MFEIQKEWSILKFMEFPLLAVSPSATAYVFGG